MLKIKNRAWFLGNDGRAPQTLYVMFDNKNNNPDSDIFYKRANKFEAAKINKIIFNVSENKWAKPEHILKWDFLPNSTGIPLANSCALELLDQVAPEQFQAIPTEIRMPDGSILSNYKLINILKKVKAIDYSKCVLKEERYRTDWDMYKEYWYRKDSLGHDIHLAKDFDRIMFFGSETLRKAVKKAKLTGLTFKESYGGVHRFIEG